MFHLIAKRLKKACLTFYLRYKTNQFLSVLFGVYKHLLLKKKLDLYYFVTLLTFNTPMIKTYKHMEIAWH